MPAALHSGSNCMGVGLVANWKHLGVPLLCRASTKCLSPSLGLQDSRGGSTGELVYAMVGVCVTRMASSDSVGEDCRTMMALPRILHWNSQPGPCAVSPFNTVEANGNVRFEAWFDKELDSDRSWDVDADQ